MVREATERTLSIKALRKELQAWLDGVKQKDKAEVAVSIAKILIEEAKSYRLKKETVRASHQQEIVRQEQRQARSLYVLLGSQKPRTGQPFCHDAEKIRQQLHTALHFHQF